MSRVIKFEYIWKHELSLCKGIYTLSQVQQGCAKAPKSKSGGMLRCWELIATRQFIGIKDINGADIYEGDKVNHRKLGEAEVIYHFGQCKFVLNTEYSEPINSDYVEVIGNVYEIKT